MTGRVCLVDGCVILCMPAPLEATETLMPELMDVDKIRYLFETRMRVRGNFDVRDSTWFPTISVPIGRRGCKMTQRLDWFLLGH